MEIDAATARLLADPSQATDALFSMKTSLGYDGLQGLAGAIYRRAGIKGDACLYPEPVLQIQAAIDMVLRSETEGDWRENRKRAASIIAYLEAAPVHPVRIDTLPPAIDPRSLEYAVRVTRDQAWRGYQGTLRNRTGWAQALNSAVWVSLQRVLDWKVCVIDRENGVWLKADLAANGWPRISATSIQTDHDAWLLVQHADADRAFQMHALEIMKPLAALGETNPDKYALLRFRVTGSQSSPP